MAKKTRPGRLRIVAGKWRSRLLDIADVDGLRPTAERIRETLFNWLAPTIAGSRCLDLCAGTGALGLEALSRGAKQVVFVEKSPVAARTLRANADLLEAEGAEIRQDDALGFLGRPPGQPFDIIFLDPPFAAAMHGELCRLLDENAWLRRGSLVYIEEDRATTPVDLPQGWDLTRSKTAGNVRYSLARTGDRA
ncbi:MAG: 16S rRNA (guanine(966)-N(2))-methyltransferase RsmD [Woeseiaceae bacterium]|nr:16S rRNA (guanine(966)-N(2))-methyltransferase RsmD [Woeseiaceae bacterium]